MADKKITQLTALTTPAINDLVPIVDISDSTMSPGGTTKYIAYGNLMGITLISTGDISTGADVNPVSIPGMSFNFEANSKYVIDMYMMISSAASTTGCGFQLDVSVAVTNIALTFVHQLANTGTLSGGNSTADDASNGVSSGLPASATVYPVHGGGLLITGASAGTAQFRYRSETTAVTTCKANSIVVITKVA